jgi:hypothetical protein
MKLHLITSLVVGMMLTAAVALPAGDSSPPFGFELIGGNTHLRGRHRGPRMLVIFNLTRQH